MSTAGAKVHKKEAVKAGSVYLPGLKLLDVPKAGYPCVPLICTSWRLTPDTGPVGTTILDFSSSGSPIALEKRLASDPAFFAEVIALVFRSKHEDENSSPPSEQTQNLARNAYTLLREWKTCPGVLPDGSFDPDAFRQWLEEVVRITAETGHGEVAQTQVGQILTYAPPDPDGLWIHRVVAAALNERNAKEIRSGFTTELFNQRGAYWFSAGEEERKLAQLNREKAEALEKESYSRFATALRKVADIYEQDAERESKRNPRDYLVIRVNDGG